MTGYLCRMTLERHRPWFAAECDGPHGYWTWASRQPDGTTIRGVTAIAATKQEAIAIAARVAGDVLAVPSLFASRFRKHPTPPTREGAK